MKAAIIDQHSTFYPNQTFIEEATHHLESQGFAVDLYQGDAVTVNLYRYLPDRGYQFIILRTHSAVALDRKKRNYGIWLFTSEPYRETSYLSEQRTNQLAQARIDEGYPFVFAIGPRFVTNSMKGNFSNSVIIMMGCGPMYLEDMAAALVGKGASICLGWNERARLSYLDDATLELISRLLTKEMTISQAVASVMSQVGPDPAYGATLKFYPPQSSDKNIRQLLTWLPDK